MAKKIPTVPTKKKHNEQKKGNESEIEQLNRELQDIDYVLQYGNERTGSEF